MSMQERVEGVVLRGMLALPPRVQRLLAGRTVVVDGQTLAVDTQLTLRLQRLARAPRVETMPVELGRPRTDHEARIAGGVQPIGAVRDLEVEGLPARLYTPTNAVEPTGLLVFFHGGGFYVGGLDSHDAPCRVLAEQAGVRVLAIDYRLAPEHPFPAAYDDAVTAYRWATKNAESLGADPARLAVGGDSAGGNLAAGVALAAAREGLPLAFQLLVYPATDSTRATESLDLFADGYYLTSTYMERANTAYLPNADDVTDPRASPLLDDVPARPRAGLRGDGRLRPAARRGRGLRPQARGRRRDHRAQAVRRPDARVLQHRRGRPHVAGGRRRDRPRPAGRPRPVAGLTEPGRPRWSTAEARA